MFFQVKSLMVFSTGTSGFFKVRSVSESVFTCDMINSVNRYHSSWVGIFSAQLHLYNIWIVSNQHYWAFEPNLPSVMQCEPSVVLYCRSSLPAGHFVQSGICLESTGSICRNVFRALLYIVEGWLRCRSLGTGANHTVHLTEAYTCPNIITLPNNLIPLYCIW